MELLVLLLPFFLAGIGAALLSKLSGVAMSMVLVPTILCLGATPIEVVSFMFLFVLYNNFTVETQDVRLDFKQLLFFKGWALIIPILIMLGVAFFSPALSIVLFVAYFIVELGGALYKRLPIQEQPEKSQVIIHSVLAAITTLLGVALVRYIPDTVYFGLVGVAILLITWFAWFSSKHRSMCQTWWTYIWSIGHILFGVFGVEASRYPKALRRYIPQTMDTMMPLVTVVASFVGIIYVYADEGQFSLPAFAAAIGAALTIRITGLYEFPKRGTFSYLAIAVAVLAVICLYLVSPTPTGFSGITTIFNQPVM